MCAVGPEFATDRRQPSATGILTSNISTSQYMVNSMMDLMILEFRLDTANQIGRLVFIYTLFFSSLL